MGQRTNIWGPQDNSLGKPSPTDATVSGVRAAECYVEHRQKNMNYLRVIQVNVRSRKKIIRGEVNQTQKLKYGMFSIKCRYYLQSIKQSCYGPYEAKRGQVIYRFVAMQNRDTRISIGRKIE